MQDAGTARNRRTKSGSLRAAREDAASPGTQKRKTAEAVFLFWFRTKF